jgi:hypothetical protein
VEAVSIAAFLRLASGFPPLAGLSPVLIAKSTIEVPCAAAIVPDSKSSAEVVPPNGMSRCVWTSIPPGMTYFPEASIVRSASIESDDPINETFSSSIRTSPL